MNRGLALASIAKVVHEFISRRLRVPLFGESRQKPRIRDYALIAILIGTAARAGGVAGRKIGNFKHDGTQYILRFREKGGEIIPIPVR